MTQRQYFGTDGIRGRVGQFPIDAEFFLKLGWAVGCVLGKNDRRPILIGKDTRISGYLFESALEAGLASSGIDSFLLGPVPTPAVAHLVPVLGAQAGIVITASHNPYTDNGIKFFSQKGMKLSDDIELAIEAQLQRPFTTVPPDQLGKATRINDAADRYRAFCQTSLGALSLSGLKIVLDCANGATYHVAPALFQALGAQVVALGVAPNGLNINQNGGATYLAPLKARVLAEKADLGIAFDGDGDRVMMVDHRGEYVDGDELLFIIVKHLTKSGKCSGGVVGTQMSNLGLEQAVRGLGLDFYRAKVGDRYVLEALLERQWQIGGEASGHLVNLQLGTTGDGILSALQVLLAISNASRCLYDLKSEIKKYPQTLINVPKTLEGALTDYAPIQAALTEAEKTLGSEGRVLLRKSGTEPLVRVMVEGRDMEKINQIAQKISKSVEIST